MANIHETSKKNVADDFDGYKEKEPKSIKAKLGEARQAEFTANGSMGSKLRGIRTTMLSNDRRITVVCYCPSSEWKTLKPAFNKVVDSVGR